MNSTTIDQPTKPVSLANQESLNEFSTQIEEDFIAELLEITGNNPRRFKRLVSISLINFLFLKFTKKDMKINTYLICFFEVLKMLKRKYFYDKFAKNYKGELIRQLKLYIADEGSDEQEEHSVNQLFYTLFEEIINPEMIQGLSSDSDEQTFKEILEEIFGLKNISDIMHYISISSIIDSDHDPLTIVNSIESSNNDTLNWQAISQITDHKNVKLAKVLQKYEHNERAKNFVYWFFDTFNAEEKKLQFGFQSNIHIYRRNKNKDWKKNFILRFELTKTAGDFLIKFVGLTNEYQTIINDKFKKSLWEAANQKNQENHITVTDDNLESIKSCLKTLFDKDPKELFEENPV